ncbi:CHASE2 domain-containing protein [Pseudoluteimonas lycopersici]|uniref:CHASE2 domain-containing protein n=1 Tax=Pseudoluteimonas lycopersici TaxID=1324796 RepID=A0A516V426_9GAMM|nr:CHASE2 domain-containing protein [Lysobacter lycopersici]QDQ73285.1 CHASE2 domain-containing protein [Lysobacter lycopersici]
MAMPRFWRERVLPWLESLFAWLGYSFVNRWGALERGYRRPLARIALKLRFAFYPLLVVGALGWLAWDWHHDRNLASAEDAIFDQVIKLRPWEPKPSGKVAIVEIDDCSIAQLGPWPWSRQQHADLLDALDGAGVRAVGFDVMFVDASNDDPGGDATLEAMAEGGGGRFLFGATRVPPGFDDAKGAIPVSQVPGAFPLSANAQRPGPRVALLRPYGEAMRKYSALVDIDRDADGVLRDVNLRGEEGDWALPSLSLRLASVASGRAMSSYPASIRVNWRRHSRLPYISAADLVLPKPACDPNGVPDLKGRAVLVGYTAAGLNDAKPTPANMAMPGVEVHAEATEALLTDGAIWMPPASFKYLLAAFLVAFTGFAFWRGEPAWELDAIFVASNILLVVAAFIGLTAFGVFFDIFAALGFVSLCFGLCRVYAAAQRGRAIGNDDYRPQFDAQRDRWLAMVRLRFVPDEAMERRALSRRIREYRRRLRGWLYHGHEAVAIEGIVEYKHWLWDALVDVNVLTWGGPDRATVVATAERELRSLREYLAGRDDVLPDDGSVRVASLISTIAVEDEPITDTRARVSHMLGRLLASTDERPLSAHDSFAADETGPQAPA